MTTCIATSTGSICLTVLILMQGTSLVNGSTRIMCRTPMATTTTEGVTSDISTIPTSTSARETTTDKTTATIDAAIVTWTTTPTGAGETTPVFGDSTSNDINLICASTAIICSIPTTLEQAITATTSAEKTTTTEWAHETTTVSAGKTTIDTTATLPVTTRDPFADVTMTASTEVNIEVVTSYADYSYTLPYTMNGVKNSGTQSTTAFFASYLVSCEPDTTTHYSTTGPETTKQSTFTDAVSMATTTPPPCSSSPCQNNSTCQSSGLGDFHCLCPPSWIENAIKITLGGPLCEQRIVSVTGPIVLAMKPLFGPVAGGTVLTLTGKYFDKFVPYLINMGPLIAMTASANNGNDTVAYFRSPPANESAIDMELPVSVEFNTGLRKQLDLHFVYKGNPEITDIHPVEHIISGGTALTVEGANMDAVAYPALKITQVYKFLYSAGPNPVFKQNVTIYYSVCSLNTQDSMLCQMPPLKIPEEFLPDSSNTSSQRRRRKVDWYGPWRGQSDGVLMTNKILTYSERTDSHDSKRTQHDSTLTSRVKRATSNKIPLSMENSSLEFVIGFVLDGFDKFEDLSEALPHKTLALFPPPSFRMNSDVLIFNPDENSTVSVKGNGMLNGASMTDYVVNIGLSRCNLLNLVDNLLTCAPPIDVPEYHPQDSARCGKDLFALMVLVGFHENLVGCLEYRLTSGIPLLYIVVGACGGGIILIFLLVCLAVRFYNNRKHPSNSGRRGKAAKSMDDELELNERRREIRGPGGPYVTVGFDSYDLSGSRDDIEDNYVQPEDPHTSTPWSL